MEVQILKRLLSYRMMWENGKMLQHPIILQGKIIHQSPSDIDVNDTTLKGSSTSLCSIKIVSHETMAIRSEYMLLIHANLIKKYICLDLH